MPSRLVLVSTLDKLPDLIKTLFFSFASQGCCSKNFFLDTKLKIWEEKEKFLLILLILSRDFGDRETWTLTVQWTNGFSDFETGLSLYPQALLENL